MPLTSRYFIDTHTAPFPEAACGGGEPSTRPGLILGTCEHVTFHAKRGFTGGRVIKDLRWENMLGPSGRREAEVQRRGDNGAEVRGMWGSGLRMQHFYKLEKARNGVSPESQEEGNPANLFWTSENHRRIRLCCFKPLSM